MGLQAITSRVKIGIEKSKKNNEYVAFLQDENKKKYVHSKYNPKVSAKQLLDLEDYNNETIWFVFGLGLGYVATELLEVMGESNKLIIVEPTNELFQKQKEYIKYLIEDKRVHIFYGDEEERLQALLKENIKVKDLKNIKLIINPVYEEYFKAYYISVTNIINEYINYIRTSFYTYNKFIENNLTNIIANRRELSKSNDIRKYKDKYKNIPALIVSAGPSLSKNISHIKDFKGVIFTGTRTLQNIKAENQTPHFLVCADPGQIAYDILRNHKENDINLIATANASPQVVQYNTGKQYFIDANGKNMSKQILGIELPTIKAFGSVAVVSLTVAQYMGCNPIIFIGQDLAHTGEKAHVDNYKSYDVTKTERVYTKGSQEENVPTTTSLLLFLRWIEQFIKETKDVTTYYNCTEGGAWIEGAKHEPFKDVIERYNNHYEITYTHEPLNDANINMEDVFNQFMLECSEISLFLKNEVDVLEKIKVNLNKNIDASITKVNKFIKEKNEILNELYLVEWTKEEMKLENKIKSTDQEEKRVLCKLVKTINVYKHMGERLKYIQASIAEYI